ncbi:hypothetical protein OBBRIDRAFT_517466 [Obba rivulosa]|uniref:Uncharacterized protein n=1 Tax=Obba rivulosa TaxID=1052685 RepID=A0A8E2AV77_9APHY|nr:hypothetical protein OBBRIDRAFT_517466 [Obba rivulosa]
MLCSHIAALILLRWSIPKVLLDPAFLQNYITSALATQGKLMRSPTRWLSGMYGAIYAAVTAARGAFPDFQHKIIATNYTFQWQILIGYSVISNFKGTSPFIYTA